MIGDQFKKLQNYVEKSDIKYIDYIDKGYGSIAKTKKDIVVGFGCVSHDYGLSQGFPIDIYTMLLKAEDIRRNVLEKDAKVHILIGDHFAYNCTHPSCENKNDVTAIINQYVKKLEHILKNLKIDQHYQFHLSSDIVQEQSYKDIREDLEERGKKVGSTASADTNKILSKSGIYNESNRDYFIDQTSLFKYLYDKKDCAIKISWAKSTKGSEIRRSSWDEPHFDRFYRDLYHDHGEKLSFVYTKPGYAVNRIDEKSRVIPYTAAKNPDVERLFVSKKEPIPEKVECPSLQSSIQDNVNKIKEISPIQIDEDLIKAFSALVVNDPTVENDFTNNVKVLRFYTKKPNKVDNIVNNKTVKPNPTTTFTIT